MQHRTPFTSPEIGLDGAVDVSNGRASGHHTGKKTCCGDGKIKVVLVAEQTFHAAIVLSMVSPFEASTSDVVSHWVRMGVPSLESRCCHLTFHLT